MIPLVASCRVMRARIPFTETRYLADRSVAPARDSPRLIPQLAVESREWGGRSQLKGERLAVRASGFIPPD